MKKGFIILMVIAASVSILALIFAAVLLPGVVSGMAADSSSLLQSNSSQEVTLSDEGQPVVNSVGSDEVDSGGGTEADLHARASAASDTVGTLVYFTPQDSDDTATVLFLYNTDSITHTVSITSFNELGGFKEFWSIDIPSNVLVKAVSDAVDAARPSSWAVTFEVNFTDFAHLASAFLPVGVKIDGYMLYNGDTGTIDPRAAQGAIPLRFSTDPSTLFMPTLQKMP